MWTADIMYPIPNCYSSIYFNSKSVYVKDGKMMIPGSVYDHSLSSSNRQVYEENQMCSLSWIRVLSVVVFDMTDSVLNPTLHVIGSTGTIKERVNEGMKSMLLGKISKKVLKPWEVWLCSSCAYCRDNINNEEYTSLLIEWNVEEEEPRQYLNKDKCWIPKQ